MEIGLAIRESLFGSESDDFFTAVKAVGEVYNRLSIECLKQEDYSKTLTYLQKAQNFTQHDPTGKAMTFNNFACYYRQQGKLGISLKYLKRALAIDDTSKEAESHLNICAVLSDMGHHTAALQHAQLALELLEDELFVTSDNATDLTKIKICEGNNANIVDLDRIAMVVIAHYNIGSEHEFLKDSAKSLFWRQKGVGIAEQYLGHEHPMSKALKNSCWSLEQTILSKKLPRISQ